MPNPDLSIITVNYNTAEHLQQCLAAVFAFPTRHSLEVIVVDNASKVDPAPVVAGFPGVRLLKNRYNVGFAEANNQAYVESTGRFVMTLNPDAVVQPGCLDSLCDFLDEHPSAGLAAALNVEGDGAVRLPSTTFHIVDPPTTLRALRRRLQGSRAPAIPTDPYRVDWAWTTGYVCRRAALRPDVFFYDSLFLFVEEYELCKGIRERGYELFVVPAARLHHAKSVTWNRNDEKLMMARQLGMAGLWSIRRKHFGQTLASLNQAMILGEATALWAALSIKGRLFGESNPRMVVDYKAQALASLRLLRNGQAFVDEINEKAARFFNDGAPRPADVRAPAGSSR